MRLEDVAGITELRFDLPNRTLDVYHTQDNEQIVEALADLNLGAAVAGESTVDGVAAAGESNDDEQRRLLWQVLAINASFFVVEMLTGFLSNSMGLVADSLDMLADALVYGMALFAVGGTLTRKKRIAAISGYFQLILAVFGFIEVLRRFLTETEVPAFQTMIVVSALALAGNALSLYLLQKGKNREAHMEASMIFTSNDVVINIGVIAAGGLVFLTASKFPDLAIGTIVFVIVARGAYRILQLAK